MSAVCDLTNKHCVPCEGGVDPIGREQAESMLTDLPGWALSEDGRMISKRFEFRGFYRTMSFVNAMAWIVNNENHHPDFSAGYNYCEIGFSTHAIDGLSENDFICAAKVNALIEEYFLLRTTHFAVLVYLSNLNSREGLLVKSIFMHRIANSSVFTCALASCILLLAGACSSTGALNSSAEALPIHHYFTESPAGQVYKLSPDGTKLAALEILHQHNDERNPHEPAINLTVTDLLSGLKYLTTDFEQTSVSGFAWANNERLLFYAHSELDLLAVNYDGSLPRRLNHGKQYLQAIHRLPDLPETILVARPGRNGQQPNIYEMNIISGRSTAVQSAPGQGFPEQWMTRATGQVSAAVVSDHRDRVVVFYDNSLQKWQETRRESSRNGNLKLLTTTLQGTTGYALTTDPDYAGAVELRAFDFRTGHEGDLLVSADGRDCCELLFMPGSSRLISVSTALDHAYQTKYFSAEFEQLALQLSATLGQRDIRFISLDDQRTRAVILATSPLHNPGWYLYDFHQHALQLLSESPRVIQRLAEHRDAARIRAIEEQHARFAMGLGLRNLQDQRGGPRQVDTVSSHSAGGSGGN